MESIKLKPATKNEQLGCYCSILKVDIEKYYKTDRPSILRAEDVRDHIRGMISQCIEQGFTPVKAVWEPLPDDFETDSNRQTMYLAVRSYITLYVSRRKPLKKEGNIKLFYGNRVEEMSYGTETDTYRFIGFEDKEEEISINQ